MRFCKHCGRMVRGTKTLGVFSWILIVLLSGATLGLFLVVWLPWFFLFKRYACPICGATDLQKRSADANTP